MDDKWTAERAREELPHVEVRFDDGLLCGAQFRGYTSGRNNDFATVVIPDISPAIHIEYSWWAIARHMNTGEPLIA